jgi:hypothetical protein
VAYASGTSLAGSSRECGCEAGFEADNFGLRTQGGILPDPEINPESVGHGVPLCRYYERPSHECVLPDSP